MAYQKFKTKRMAKKFQVEKRKEGFATRYEENGTGCIVKWHK